MTSPHSISPPTHSLTHSPTLPPTSTPTGHDASHYYESPKQGGPLPLTAEQLQAGGAVPWYEAHGKAQGKGAVGEGGAGRADIYDAQGRGLVYM